MSNDWHDYLEMRLAAAKQQEVQERSRWPRLALCALVVGVWVLAVVGIVEIVAR